MAADRAVGRHGVAVDDRQLARHRSCPDRVGGGLLRLLPRIGFLNGEQFAAGVNVRTCIYVARITG